jgi:protein-S-isoprenylcysteine O-methyltransferase Ste14
MRLSDEFDMTMPIEEHERTAALPDDDGFARFWNAIPDVVFRIVGVAVFLGYVLWRAGNYERFFPFDNAAWQSNATRTGLRLAQELLIDATYLLIVAGFCVRIRPIRRTTDAGRIALAMVGAFWPFLPLIAEPIFAALDPELGRDWHHFVWRNDPTTWQVLLAGGLVISGLVIEVWSYSYLLRSLSIVPEARELKVTGPYRLVQHPIYFGQFLAQAGVWLVLANTHLVWIAFYLIFVGLQLARTRMEDRVLAEAFGETYLSWKRRTFWFV